MYFVSSLLSFLFLTLFLISFKKIYNSKNRFGFIYFWGFIFGAFVWEDLLLISLFSLAVTILTIFLRDLRIGLLIFLIYWIVRPAGETLYFFMQQFLRPDHSPHDIKWHFEFLDILFGKLSTQKYFILLQVFFQLIMVVSISLMILLLKFWSQIPAWF